MCRRAPRSILARAPRAVRRGKELRLPAQTFNTPVLVVGAGPVGAVLALELARHNVPSMVVERSPAASAHPKMDYLSGRSMELLRRLGLAKPIRQRGIGAQYTTNFLWIRGF